MNKNAHFEQALAAIQSLIRIPPRPYQARAATALRSIRALLQALDNPQYAYPTLHITGSKGKGSCALLLEQILQAAGYRVGVFTSPHLQHWTERFRIEGQPISETRFAALVETVWPQIDIRQAANPHDPPTFFDALTAMALVLFQQEKVDYAILEVGLGGRLDATNIIEPAVCCITSIELEHHDKLGPTLLDIAREKAGIIKPGAPVICGQLPPSTQNLIDARAASFDTPVLCYERDFKIQPLADGQLLYAGFDLQQVVEFPLAAPLHQLNAALAISCALALKSASRPQLLKALDNGLGTATLPGRCELISHQPWILLDSAHTLASATALRCFIDTLPVKQVHWLLSFTTGKQAPDLVASLHRPGDRITLTQADAIRSQPAHTYLESLRRQIDTNIVVIANPQQAILSCLADLLADELFCISGSVYLVGQARQLLLQRFALD